MGRLLLLAAWLLLAGSAASKPPQGAAALCLNDAGALPAAQAPLFDIGSYRGPRVSADQRAQRLFDQGLVFGWGFNFAEAVRSFRAATLADLECALCRWGIAWALGPSINHDMRAVDVPVALDAIEQARAYAPDATSRERALIDALAERYRGLPKADPDRVASAYADAMRRLAARYAGDADLAVLAAEAIMNAHPYDYWRTNGRPQPWTPSIVALLDRAIAIAPDHPGGHHYRVHLYDGSPTPQAAAGSADRLRALAPAVGHLVHMPAHIDLRLGRYHDAVVANRAAVESDRAYLARVQENASYAADYVPHNVHFLWVAALWSGESAVARDAAQSLAHAARALDDDARGGTRQHLQAATWLTDVRFGDWQAILERPAPAADAPYLAGIARFARGVAHVARAEVADAEREANALRALEGDVRARKLRIKNTHDAAHVLALARSMLAAEIALARGAPAAAVQWAMSAVAAEDRLEADEPPVWALPARHALGRALLAAGRAREARTAFGDDLVRHPENAIALAGAAAAERRLGRAAAADALDRRARAAWAHADRPLPIVDQRVR